MPEGRKNRLKAPFKRQGSPGIRILAALGWIWPIRDHRRSRTAGTPVCSRYYTGDVLITPPYASNRGSCALGQAQVRKQGLRFADSIFRSRFHPCPPWSSRPLTGFLGSMSSIFMVDFPVQSPVLSSLIASPFRFLPCTSSPPSSPHGRLHVTSHPSPEPAGG